MKNSLPSDFFDELLTYSGQYAIFYFLMRGGLSWFSVFSEISHLVLLFAILVQAYVLARWWKDPVRRLGFSLIAPAAYSIFELSEWFDAATSAAHVFFWVFSIFSGIFGALSLKSWTSFGIRVVSETAITFLNVFAFLFLYFYFDSYLEALRSSSNRFPEELSAWWIWSGIGTFFADPTHSYVALWWIALAVMLSLWRFRILQLWAKVEELFGTYVDRSVRNRILAEGKSPSVKKTVSVVFSDIRGFTSLSETKDAEEIVEMLNGYFSEWEKSVSVHWGIIDKFIGDAVMATFESDQRSEHVKNAVASALDMLGKIPSFQGKYPWFSIGIGVHVGEVISGDVGSETRRNHTVIGDCVNVASRLESACKEFLTDCVVSEDVFRELPENFQFRFGSEKTARLKGKTKPFKIRCHISLPGGF